jgi:Fe2+ or Zn2+ uptake regulation protein
MMIEADTSDLAEALRARGRRVTSQRLVVLRELRRLGSHVTAEEVHAAVAESLPGVSAPTIYATLDLLVELGLVRRFATGGTAQLYDARQEPHQHVVCRSCGRVEDVDADLDVTLPEAAAAASGFQDLTAELVLQGLCGDCARRLSPV